MAAAIITGLLVGWATGGSLERLSQVRLRWAALAVAALLAQSAIPAWLGGGFQARTLVWVWVVFAAIACAVCLANWRVAGMWIVGVGLVLNLAVVAVNVGMPIGRGAVASFGEDAVRRVSTRSSDFYHIADDETRLLALADVIPLSWLPSPQLILSAGDILMALGVSVVVARGMHAKTGLPTHA